MCFFQLVKFENYTSEPRIKPTYFEDDESIKDYRRRQRDNQREAAATNVAQNATGRAYTQPVRRRLLKVAEDEKPEYIAHSDSV